MNEKPRNVFLDIVKAFAIICVVLGHCIQYGSGNTYLTESSFFNNVLFKVIYSFHMPLFMIVSGYLFAYSVNKKTYTELIASKVNTLLIPIVFWSLIPFGISILKQINNEHQYIYWCGKYINILLHNLWFLWAIFWCSVIVTLVKKIFKDSKWIYLVGFVMTFIAPDVLNLLLYKYMYPFFIIGYFYNKDGYDMKLKEISQKRISMILAGITFVILFSFYNYDSYIYTSGYKIIQKNFLEQILIDFYRFIIGLVGSIFILLVLYRITKHIKGIKKIIIYIGQNTFGVYIISQFVFSYVINRITYNLPGINYLVIILETIFILSFSLLCTRIIKYSKLLNRLLLGGR